MVVKPVDEPLVKLLGFPPELSVDTATFHTLEVFHVLHPPVVAHEVARKRLR